ncbi:MAG: hypothetical protein JNK82_24890, partial [Myxococcaceae bacterium]|nr:hypothetical protein [Myxococcaceae bacterium]
MPRTSEARVWVVRWGDRVVATGTGPLPREYGFSEPRVSNGDRAVVRSGAFSAEVWLAPKPPRPFIWGAPDVHFLKVATLCFMAFAAVLVLVRERVEELRVAKLIESPEEPEDIFATPRYARFAPHRGFTAASAPHGTPVPKRDLERIERFPSKVKELQARDAVFASMLAPATRGYAVLGVLRASEPTRRAALGSSSSLFG